MHRGSPKGELITVSTGIISNADNDFDIRITAPISPGSSGGVLIDDNYKVIGVTYAGYNALDAQNINYAIDKKYLKEMMEWYDRENTFELKGNDLTSGLDIDYPSNKSYTTISNINIFRSTDTLDTFYKNTSIINKFSSALKEKNIDWYNLYNSFTAEEQYECINLFENFEEYCNEVRGKNIPKGINSISDTIQYYSLEQILYEFIVDKYQYMIIKVKAVEYDNSQELFEFIEGLPLENGQKLILKYCLVYKDINYFNSNEKEEIFNWLKIENVLIIIIIIIMSKYYKDLDIDMNKKKTIIRFILINSLDLL